MPSFPPMFWIHHSPVPCPFLSLVSLPCPLYASGWMFGVLLYCLLLLQVAGQSGSITAGDREMKVGNKPSNKPNSPQALLHVLCQLKMQIPHYCCQPNNSSFWCQHINHGLVLWALGASSLTCLRQRSLAAVLQLEEKPGPSKGKGKATSVSLFRGG